MQKNQKGRRAECELLLFYLGHRYRSVALISITRPFLFYTVERLISLFVSRK